MTNTGTLRGVTLALLVSLSSIMLAAPPAGAVVTAYVQSVAEAASDDAAVAAFYRERDFRPIWTSKADAARRAAFFRALETVETHGLPAARYDAAGLRAAFETTRSERERGRLEVAMSRAFLAYARDIGTGILDPGLVDDGIKREVLRRDPVQTLRAFAASSPAAFLRALPPQSQTYAQLRKVRLDLVAAIARGGWGPRVSAGKLEPGAAGPAVVALRDRLMAMGYLPRTATQTYDAAIQRAVQLFQIDNGLTADGIAGQGTLEVINLGPEARLQSVLVALERLRWMNGFELGDRHIWVNLPEFTARIVDDGKVTFETITVVGMNQHDRRSPEFSDEMEHMVVNPTWNVPRSIAVRDYLPKLQQNPNAAGYMRLFDGAGRVVDRSAVDFTQFTPATFPFDMKQPPSNRNALGLVKFMFPNRHNIYLHDTPSKNLFEREVRAYSSGCIRLQQPFEFAYQILERQSADPKGVFHNTLDSGRETMIELERHIPVHIVYFTAWPDAKGRMTYRRDIYGRDGRIFNALSAAGVSLLPLRG